MRNFRKIITGIPLFIFALLIMSGVALADEGEVNISSGVYFIDMSNAQATQDGYYGSTREDMLYIEGVYDKNVTIQCEDDNAYGLYTADYSDNGGFVNFYVKKTGSYFATITVGDSSFDITILAVEVKDIQMLNNSSSQSFLYDAGINGLHLNTKEQGVVNILEDGTIQATECGEAEIYVYADFFDDVVCLTTFFVDVADPVLEEQVVVIDVTDCNKDSSGFFDVDSIALKVKKLQYIKYLSVNASSSFSVQTDVSGDVGYIFLKPNAVGTYTVKINAGGKILTAKVAVIQSAAPKMQKNLGSKFKITVKGANSLGKLTFKSSNENIATIDTAGNVTTVSKGNVNLYAYYSINGKRVFTQKIALAVTDLVVTKSEVYIDVYGIDKINGCYSNGYKVTVGGINKDTDLKIACSDYIKCSYVFVSSKEKYILIEPKRTGTFTVTLNANGKRVAFKVYVSNLHFTLNGKSLVQQSSTWVDGYSNLLLYKGESTKLNLLGIPKGCTVKYKVGNSKVARVDSSGNVTAVGGGNTVVVATLGNLKVTYKVSVSYKQAVLAIRYAKNNFNASYSQAKRMQNGYYDCSSYVWRSYAAAGKYIGGSKTYAPTAAGLCQYYAERGYMIYSGTVDVSKLKPGDLVFECGANNGRYKGIYHVDLYQGNNSTLTVGRLKYCGTKLYNVAIVRLFK